jgi:hypothetical protein
MTLSLSNVPPDLLCECFDSGGRAGEGHSIQGGKSGPSAMATIEVGRWAPGRSDRPRTAEERRAPGGCDALRNPANGDLWPTV